METDFSKQKEKWTCPTMTNLSLKSNSCSAEVSPGCPYVAHSLLRRTQHLKVLKTGFEKSSAYLHWQHLWYWWEQGHTCEIKWNSLKLDRQKGPQMWRKFHIWGGRRQNCLGWVFLGDNQGHSTETQMVLRGAKPDAFNTCKQFTECSFTPLNYFVSNDTKQWGFLFIFRNLTDINLALDSLVWIIMFKMSLRETSTHVIFH